MVEKHACVVHLLFLCVVKMEGEEDDFSLVSEDSPSNTMRSVNERLGIIKVNVQLILDEILKLENLLNQK